MRHLFFILFLFLSLTVFGQSDFELMYNQGLRQERQQLYYKAILSYTAAISMTDNQSEIQKAKKRIDYCANRLEKLKREAEQARKKAEQEKMRADSLLAEVKQALDRAEQMQRKVETAMFDKAVKEHFSDWLGYDRYDWSIQYDGATKKGPEILSKIDSLDLSHNALLRVPIEVTMCPNLKHINLIGNPDIDWEGVFQIIKYSHVNSIYVSVYDLSDIDSAYWHLITGVEILRNGLNEIPENILQQKQLTYLDLRGEGEWFFDNNIQNLPQQLFELTNLKYLNLNNCNIKILPRDIGNLTNLTELDLDGNDLTTLPAEIGNLTNLTELDLSMNNLTTLPAEIGNLTNLTELDLSMNNLTTLPAEIGNLTNLVKLYLYKNQLTSLPVEIGNLTNLVKLYLYKNQLTSLPVEIGNLTNLFSLVLCCNQLTTLPSEVGTLKNLTKLNLYDNNLTSLPPEIGKLTVLTELYLSSNQLDKRKFTEFLKSCSKPVKLTADSWAYNNDPSFLLIEVDKIEPEWLELPNVSEY